MEDEQELTDEELRAERVYRATIQEQKFVRNCRDPAFRVSDGRQTDCIVFRHNCIEIIDCKFSDNDVFYIDKYDIEKGLDLVQRIEQRNLPVQFGVDMHFPKQRRHRIIYLDERHRGHSIKTWVAGRRIMTVVV